MSSSFYDDDGNVVKQCTKCKQVLPVEDYYKDAQRKDGYTSRCRACTLEGYKEQNRRRNKKRKQKTHKLTKHQVDWIKEQKGKLSVRETAKQFANKFWAIKVNPSTVQRIFTGKIHTDPGEADTVSVYDLLEGASDFTGSIEEYLDSTDTSKIKF